MDAEEPTIEQAARRAISPTGTTLEEADERAVERLILAYGVCVDFGFVDELVDLFTPGAVWDGREFRFPVCRGAEELRRHFAAVCPPGLRQVHVMEAPLLRAGEEPDVAHGFVPFNAIQARDGTVFGGQHAYGIYTDRYRRGPDGWKIERRTLRLRLVRK